ncbi:hypothetical protein HAP47_0032155 [Bradyrhizobium sp. 41S5]|uniref:hypothetical protein n=1 Tax=Bradyrhizobium sp. 41S5 TaxID=1404443 RepID=UPI001E4EBC06|nr:hypothetical protein [Bradyrhizobium sp. 41S5]UFX43831.1 hypothetical protein HAP47_0032155 [Bradyrhizobium sp. 41S5]
MTPTINDLKDQADRAERLARTGMDPVTAERLRAYAEECRNRIATDYPGPPRAGSPVCQVSH